MTTVHEPAVDALDVDAPAAAQLAQDAPRAHVTRTDGCTYIRFDSRDDFRAACEEGVVHLDNPFLIRVVGPEVVAPVLFGHGGQWRWQAEARYPAQRACDCAAEVVHQLGCSATEYPEQWMFASLDEIPVVVVDIPRQAVVAPEAGVCWRCSVAVALTPEGRAGEHAAVDDESTCCPGSGGWPATDWNDEPVPTGTFAEVEEFVASRIGVIVVELPRRTPGAAIDVHYTNLGLRAAPACGATKPTVLATVVAANVTCPSCLLAIVPVYGPEHAALAEAALLAVSE